MHITLLLCLTCFFHPSSPDDQGCESFFHLSIVEGDISLVLDSEALSRYKINRMIIISLVAFVYDITDSVRDHKVFCLCVFLGELLLQNIMLLLCHLEFLTRHKGEKMTSTLIIIVFINFDSYLHVQSLGENNCQKWQTNKNEAFDSVPDKTGQKPDSNFYQTQQ